MASSNFIAELKRRNVYKVALVYAGIAWLLLQLVSSMMEPLGIPAWTFKFVLLLIAIGFPVALVLAWALELSPEGLRQETPLADGLPTRTSIGHWIQLFLVILLCLLVGYTYFQSLRPGALGVIEQFMASDALQPTRSNGTPSSTISEKTAPAPGIAPSASRWTASVAVLPFVNMSAEKDNEYFSDGISEQLLHTLARIEGLKVPARTSSFHFKGRNQDIRTIGETLGVEHVLEGSVRRAGDQVRITAQLIQVADGAHLWSETYDRSLENIFALQDEIAQEIGSQLELQLGLLKFDSSAELGTTNVAAYEAFLRGVSEFRGSSISIEKAQQYAKRAVAFDPDFAYAHAMLAATYSALSIATPSQSVTESMTAHYERALELDPDNPIALGVKATTERLVDWDWQKSEALLRRAQENSIGTYNSNADLAYELLLPTGRVDEARRLLEEARELDPLNGGLDLLYMGLLLAQNDWPTLLSHLQGLPQFMLKTPGVSATLCRTYFELGEVEQVNAQLEKLRAIGQSAPQQVAGCEAHAHWLHGDQEAALAAYGRREDLVRSSGQSANYVLGEQAYTLGETERALDWWELALEQRDSRITMVRTAHRNEKALLARPRFQALLEKMNLDDESLRRMGYL